MLLKMISELESSHDMYDTGVRVKQKEGDLLYWILKLNHTIRTAHFDGSYQIV